MSARPISIADLINAGFSRAGCWSLSTDGVLHCDQPLPKQAGVYCFVRDGEIIYIGLASMGIAKRLYFYGRPGSTQRTSLRLNQLLKNEISAGRAIEVYSCTPPDLEWNGLTVDACAGLEVGLIRTICPPWNMRGLPR